MSGWTWVGDHLPNWLMSALNFFAAYPKGDQDALFDLGDAWKKAAADLEKLEPQLKSVTGQVPQYYVGDGATQVSNELATLLDGKDTSIQKLVESLNQLGKDARSTATEIEYTKIQSEIFAVLTLYTVVQLGMTLYGSLAVPGVLAAARVSLAAFSKAAIERIGMVTTRAAGETLAKPLVREIAVPLGERLAAPVAEKVAAPLAEQVVKPLGERIVQSVVNNGAKSIVAGLGAGAMGAGLDAGTQLIQIMEGHRDDGFDLKQTFQTSLQWGVGGAVGAPFHAKLGDVLKETRLPSRLGGAISGGVGGAIGAGGMYGTGLATQLYDNDGDWSKVDKTFHSQLLIGGLAMGAGGGANHGLQSGHGAPNEATTPAKSIPDGSSSRGAAPEVRVDPNHSVQQEIRFSAHTDQQLGHRTSDSDAGGRATPAAEAPRNDLKTNAPVTGEGGPRPIDNGPKPAETAPKTTEPATPRATQPATDTGPRAATTPTDHRGNVVSGTQDRAAPIGRTTEVKPATVTPETQTRPVSAEPAPQAERTSPADTQTEQGRNTPAPDRFQGDPNAERTRPDESQPPSTKPDETSHDPMQPHEPKELPTTEPRAEDTHPDGRRIDDDATTENPNSKSRAPEPVPLGFVPTSIPGEAGTHPTSTARPRGGLPSRTEIEQPHTRDEAKQPGGDRKFRAAEEPKTSAAENAKTATPEDPSPAAEAPETSPADNNWSPRPDDVWSKLDARQVADELADRWGIDVSGFDHPNLNPEVAREFARAIDEMLDRYPDVDLRGVSIAPIKEDGVYAETVRGVSPSGRVYTDEVILNERYALDVDEMVRDITEDVEDGHLVAGSADRPIHSSLVHEFGHVLDFESQEHALLTAEDALLEHFESTRDNLTPEEFPDAYKDWLEQLSGYSFEEDGTFEPGEALAEAFLEVEYYGADASEPAQVLYHHLIESARDHGSFPDSFEHLPDDVPPDPRYRKSRSPGPFEDGGPREEPAANPAPDPTSQVPQKTTPHEEPTPTPGPTEHDNPAGTTHEDPTPEPAEHDSAPTPVDAEQYLNEPHVSAALDRADELGVTTTIDGVDTPVSTVIRDLLPQHPELAELLRENDYLERSLFERPKTLASLLTHPDGLPLLHDAVEAVAHRGPESILAEPVHIEPTPLTPEHRAISHEITEATATVRKSARRQPGFDYGKLQDPEYQREFLKQQYDIWRPSQDTLNSVVRDIAEKTGGEPGWRDQPKDETRAWDKIKAYKGDVSRLTDLVGAKVVFDNIADAYRALEMVENDPRIRIVEFEDRFVKPKESGYRDLQMKVQLDNGHIAELRLHLSHIDEVADYEHGLFEVQRDFPALATDENREMTPHEAALSAELKRLANDRFWEATQKGLPNERAPRADAYPDKSAPAPHDPEPVGHSPPTNPASQQPTPHPAAIGHELTTEHQPVSSEAPQRPTAETTADSGSHPDEGREPHSHDVEPDAPQLHPEPQALTPHEIESQYGIPEENQRKIQQYADNHDLIIDVRPTNVDAVPHLRDGAMPKPMSIKDKTINELDVELGAPAEAKGLVGRFNPEQLTLPAEGTVPAEHYAELKKRYDQRVKDYEAYQKYMGDLIDQGTIRVREDGVVEGDFNGEWKPITGDHDLYDIRHADGSRLTPEEELFHRRELIALDAGIQHGPHVYWEPANEFQRVRNFEDIVNKHQYDPATGHGEEPLVRFRPEEQPELGWAAKDLDGLDRELTPWHIENELNEVRQRRLNAVEEQSRTHFADRPDTTPAERTRFEDELRHKIDADVSRIRQRVDELANHPDFDHAAYRGWLDDTFRTPIIVEIDGQRQPMMFIDRGQGIAPVLAPFGAPAHELAQLRQELRDEMRPHHEVHAPKTHPTDTPVAHSLDEARELGERLRDEGIPKADPGPSAFPRAANSPSPESAGGHPTEPHAAEEPPTQGHPSEVDWAPHITDEWSSMNAREIADELRSRWGVETEGFDNPAAHPEVVREFARAVDDMMSRYPDVTLPKIAVERLPDDYIAAVSWDRFPDGTVRIDPLTLNETVARAPDEIAHENAQLEADSYFVPSSGERPIYASLVHEFGHVIDLDGQLRAAKTAMDALDRHFESSRGGMDKAAYEQWLDQLSGYSFDQGKLDPHEALAEAFADVELNGEAASEPAKVLYRHLLDSAEAQSKSPNGFRIPDDIVERPTGPHLPEQHTPKPEEPVSRQDPGEHLVASHEPTHAPPADHANPDRPTTLTQHLKDRFEQLRARINDVFAAYQDPARSAELPTLRVELGKLVEPLGLRDQQDWGTPWKLFREHDASLAQYVEQNHEHLLPSREDLAEVQAKAEPHEPSTQPHVEQPHVEEPAVQHELEPRTETPEHQSELTPDELVSVHRYTDPDADIYSDLNHRMREGLELTPDQQKIVASMTAALEKLPVHDGTVWRGTVLTPEQIARYVPGAKITEAAFTSTSRDPRRIFTGKVEFVIHSETGRDISALSAKPGEKEVLFRPGTAFEVRGVVEDPNAGLFGVTRVYLYESGAHVPAHETPAEHIQPHEKPTDHTEHDGVPTDPAPVGDGHPAAELPVRHGTDRTALGDSPEVQRVYDNLRNEGEHDVIVHGDRFGKPTAEAGFEIDPQKVVEAIRNNPNYVEGTPIRLLSCHSGNDVGWAQHIADELGVPVRAPSDLVGVRALPDSPAVLPKDADWRTFHPTETSGTTPKPTVHKPTDHPDGSLPKYEEDPREDWDILGNDEGSDTSNSELSSFTEADDKALKLYSGSGYIPLNEALRSGTPLTPLRQSQVDAINQALSKLPDYSGTVYRGVSLPREVITAYEKGMVVDVKEFLSTSIRPDIADGFMEKSFSINSDLDYERVMFTVISKSGKDIQIFSSVPHEREVLFGSESKFYVADVELDEDVTYIDLVQI